MPAISSSVSGAARWLSMYQSAFWAGFMDVGFLSKCRHCARSRGAPLDRTCSPQPNKRSFRPAEITAWLARRTQSCILASAFDRRLTTLPQIKTKSRGIRQEDDDALPALESRQIRHACRIACGGACHHRQRPEEIRSRATDTEIKVGNIMPYSGPASAYATIGKTEATSTRSTPRAASTAARSISSPMTMATVRRRRWSRHASWSRTTRCC